MINKLHVFSGKERRTFLDASAYEKDEQRERERQRDRETERQTDRETEERDRGGD